MGTTKTGIQTGSAQLAFVLAIEGYEYLLTTWNNVNAVTLAWSGTGYSFALRGLRTPTDYSQSIEPFRPRLDAETMAFVISNDEDDTFAIDVFATDKTGGKYARLDADLDADDTTVTWNDTGDLQTAGVLYIGTERTTYTSKTATTTTGHTRGTPTPFAVDGGSAFGKAHLINNVSGGRVAYPWATDFPRKWVGKWVGCYCHRVVGGVLDTKAEAELVFAGTVADIQDGGPENVTVLSCVDARQKVAETVLLSDQFSAEPEEGVILEAEDSIRFRYISFSGTTLVDDDDIELIVDVGGYINSGANTAGQVIGAIGKFLTDTSTDASWAISRPLPDGLVRIRALGSSAGYTAATMRVSMSASIAGLLGFDIEHGYDTDNDVTGGEGYMYLSFGEDSPATVFELEVFATLPVAYTVALPAYVNGGVERTRMESFSGTWIDQAADLPEEFQIAGTDTGEWGFVRFDKFMLIAKHVSDTEFELYFDPDLQLAFGLDPEPIDLARGGAREAPRRNDIYVREGFPVPRYKQVILLQNDLDYIIPRIFASTGASGYNHATYDVWAHQLAARIPWDLLGDDFLNTLQHLSQMSESSTMTLLLEQPTKFEDVLLPELTLRGAHMVIKAGGGIMFATPSQPSSGTAEHTITASHKAAAPGDAATDWSEYERSRNTIITNIKVEYNRRLDGEYSADLEIVNKQAKTDHDTDAVLTIKARNSMGITVALGDSIRQLVDNLASDILLYWSRPLPVMSRSVSATKWFMTPGDTVLVSDNMIRDPATGQRGITLVPGWVVGMKWNWRTMRGDVQVILHGEESGRRVIYSPVAFVDENEGTNGYTHASRYIHLVAHEFSLSSEDKDLEHFEVDDEIRIIEKSPSTPASPSSFDRVIEAVDEANNRITLTVALPSSTSLNGSSWYIVSRDRNTAQATQQTDAYLGDDVDGKIQDSVRNRVWVSQPAETGSVTAAFNQDRHEFPPTDGEWHDDGQPLHPAIHRAQIQTANSLIAYRTAVQLPQPVSTDEEAGTESATYRVVQFPLRLYIGRGRFTALKRRLDVGPIMQQIISGTGTVRVTSSAFAPSLSGNLGAMSATFFGPFFQYTFTNTSTSIAHVAEQLMTLAVSPGNFTWLTVELKTSANEAKFFGFHTFALGPPA